MLVVLTNSGDATADYLCGRLGSAGIEHTRLDTDSLSDLLTIEHSDLRTTLHISGRSLTSQSISNVWLRRPREINSITGRDLAEKSHIRAEWAEALEGFLSQIPERKWMNHPARNVLASHKIEQLVRASAMGLAVPDTIVTQSPETMNAFLEKHRGRAVVKPLASGFLERVIPSDDTSIYTNLLGRADMKRADLLKYCPTLCQQLIEKLADVRVTIVDGNIHAVSMTVTEADGTQRLDIRRDNMRGVTYSPIDPPATVRAALMSFVRSYDLRFAAIDFGIDKQGEWFFFENNPNGQWAWLDLHGVTEIWSSFVDSFHLK